MTVLGLGVPGIQHRSAEVAVAEHHALGRTGGAGGIDEGGHVHGVGRGHAAVAGEGHVLVLDELEGVDVDHQAELGQRRVAHLLELAAGDEERLGLGMIEDALHLAGRQLVKHGYGHAPVGDGGKEGDAPVGAVLGENGHLVGGADAEVGKDARQVVARLPVAGVGVRLLSVGIFGRSPVRVLRRSVVVQIGEGLKVVSH